MVSPCKSGTVRGSAYEALGWRCPNGVPSAAAWEFVATRYRLRWKRLFGGSMRVRTQAGRTRRVRLLAAVGDMCQAWLANARKSCKTRGRMGDEGSGGTLGWGVPPTGAERFRVSAPARGPSPGPSTCMREPVAAVSTLHGPRRHLGYGSLRPRPHRRCKCMGQGRECVSRC